MPTVTFTHFDGKKTTIDAPVGMTLMEAAVDQNVDGIDGDCGGACACSTCHIYVNENWLAKLHEISAIEDDMLDFVSERKPASRLACQIYLSDNHDGLVVSTPETQG